MSKKRDELFEPVKCFVCRHEILRHENLENHHFPFTKLDGGKETVPLCKECHDLIDRDNLGDWPMKLQLEVLRECLKDESPRCLRVMLLKIWAIGQSLGYDMKLKGMQ